MTKSGVVGSRTVQEMKRSRRDSREKWSEDHNFRAAWLSSVLNSDQMKPKQTINKCMVNQYALSLSPGTCFCKFVWLQVNVAVI